MNNGFISNFFKVNRGVRQGDPLSPFLFILALEVLEVNKELYHFIWNGKDKVKRVALINDIEDGGLKMLDIECMIRAQRIICLKKNIEDYIYLVLGNSFWIIIWRKWVANLFCSVILIIAIYLLLCRCSIKTVLRHGPTLQRRR